MDTSEMASKRQNLLINNDRIPLLSGSNDKEPNFSGDNVRIKQSKTKGTVIFLFFIDFSQNICQ